MWPFVMAYNLGNFMRRLVLPEDMKHWSLTSLHTGLIKTGGRLVRHAYCRGFLIAKVRELEQEVRPTGGDREIADFGPDQKSWLFQSGEAIW